MQSIKGVDLALERFFSRGNRIDRQKNRSSMGDELFEIGNIIGHNWSKLSNYHKKLSN